MKRIKRKFWMHFLPKGKHYVCRKCSFHFITVFGRLLLAQRED